MQQDPKQAYKWSHVNQTNMHNVVHLCNTQDHNATITVFVTYLFMEQEYYLHIDRKINVKYSEVLTFKIS